MYFIIDVETTSFEENAKICSLGLLVYDDTHCIKKAYELFNEAKKIDPKVSALHNITNEMIANKSSFKESKIYQYLQQKNLKKNILVVHGEHILKQLQASGLQWNGTIIDTQRVVKHKIQECEQFSLSFLRYELKLYHREDKYKKECGLEENLFAHHALHDAVVTKMLFDYLMEEYSKEEMNTLSFRPVLLEKIPFGKYAGRYIEEILQIDKAYLVWMMKRQDLDSDLHYSIEYYLKG